MSETPLLAPFSLPWRASGFFPGAAVALGRRLAEYGLGLAKLNRCYAWTQRVDPRQPFAERALASLAIELQISADDLARIPAQGPLVIVANHPYGGLDGLALAALLQRVRPDVRLLVNYLLRILPEMAAISFLVDPFGGAAAARRNLGSMKAALRHVAAGGVLGVFPAGEVSHRTWTNPHVTDPPWSATVGRIVAHTGATVVPVFFAGGNGSLFQWAGLLHPRLRTALLPRELLNKAGRRIDVRIGNPIVPQRLAHFPDAAALTEYLRLRTYLLRGRRSAGRSASAAHAPPTARRHSSPLAPPTEAALLRGEVEALPREQCVLLSGSFSVWVARARQIPALLAEIGRLREATFRAVGEGTGQPRDLDRFDDEYRHLFLWDSAAGCVVGAYRIGLTDELLARHGPAGLYTATLFQFSPRLLREISPALELGRSFVREEYQRSHSALLLLWRGVGHFAAARPRYRYIFGAVSISDEYQALTKELLLRFLASGGLRSALADEVRAKLPPQRQRFRDADERILAASVHDLAHVDELVTDIEAEQRHIPVLLRQYLKMNARVLGFNIDPQFGHVIDALILADMARADRALLRRYYGEEGAARFLAYHDTAAAAPSAAGAAAVAG